MKFLKLGNEVSADGERIEGWRMLKLFPTRPDSVWYHQATPESSQVDAHGTGTTPFSWVCPAKKMVCSCSWSSVPFSRIVQF
jgi:hypothetical protein